MTRRGFNKRMAASFVGAAFPLGCSSDGLTYEALVASTWRHSDAALSGSTALLGELVRYATLAANSHNTQPWRFRIEPDRITVLPDFSRRCPAVDPDDHHLFTSLGCATENLVLAAEAHDLRATVSIEGMEDAIRIDLEPGAAPDSHLFQAIPRRQSTRAAYDGKQVPTDQLAMLEASARDDGVEVRMLLDRHELEEILEYVVAGNTAQMNDEAFVTELKDWIRFSDTSAVQHRDGLFAASSGNPTLPTWIGKIAFDLAFTTERENDKYQSHVRSSAGIIAFVSMHDDRQSWIRVGRCCQRFALQATALGLRHAFINQAVEVPAVRAQFADYLGIGHRRPDLLVRFGYGPELPRSLRRPVDEVLFS
jgi:nitroreductase